MQLIKYLFIFAVCLFWPFFVGYADIKQNIKIQSYLNALGYNVGQIDGIIGKNSRKQLITVLKEHGLEFDGVADSNELQILRKIATDKNIDLTDRLLGISYENLLQIMDEQTAKLFVPNSRNINKVDGFEIVDFKGRKAAKMSISMNDKGHPDDWGRFGTAGTAQRLQIQDTPRVHEMRVSLHFFIVTYRI